MKAHDNVPDVELRDLLELVKKNIMLSLNCHALGKITKFDKTTQTCEVKISYDRRYTKNTQETGQVDEEVPYPILSDVPLISLRGGDSGITFPIAVGDNCLILFNDRDMDNWWSGKTNGLVRSSRLHDMSDALAIVGVSNSKEFIQNYDDQRASIFNGTTRVAVGSDKILIENQLGTLNQHLQELVTVLQGAVISGTAFNPATISALGATALKIGSLLE